MKNETGFTISKAYKVLNANPLNMCNKKVIVISEVRSIHHIPLSVELVVDLVEQNKNCFLLYNLTLPKVQQRLEEKVEHREFFRESLGPYENIISRLKTIKNKKNKGHKNCIIFIDTINDIAHLKKAAQDSVNFGLGVMVVLAISRSMKITEYYSNDALFLSGGMGTVANLSDFFIALDTPQNNKDSNCIVRYAIEQGLEKEEYCLMYHPDALNGLKFEAYCPPYEEIR